MAAMDGANKLSCWTQTLAQSRNEGLHLRHITAIKYRKDKKNGYLLRAMNESEFVVFAAKGIKRLSLSRKTKVKTPHIESHENRLK